MEYFSFPARLRSAYNTISEYGTAQVSARENAIEFSGEFVPLLPLGTEAVVDWILGERTLVSFEGQTYLSSPTRLLLVDVDAELIEAAKATFAINTHLPAKARSAEAPRGAAKTPAYPAEIVYLSADFMTLRTKAAGKLKGRLLLDCEVDFLTLCDQPVLVRRQVTSSRSDALLLCDVLPSSNDNRIALSAYASKLEQLDG